MSRVIHEFISGSEDAFRQVYDEYVDMLRHFACKYLDDYSVVKDVVQETFISLWENRKSLKNRQTVKKFLFTGVRNRCLNHLRSKVIHKKHSARIPVETDADLLEKLIESEFADRLFNLYEELPLSMKKVYRLNLEGRNNHEIAEALGMPVDTVKKYKVRANALMRRKAGELLLILSLSPKKYSKK